MKRSPLLIVAVFAATLFFVSCKNSGTSDLAIPKDAAMIVHIDAKSLTSKLSWKEIQQSEWFKEMYKSADDSLQKKILEDPSNSGVDLKSDFVFFMQGQGRNTYMVFEGKLNDASKFETVLKKMHSSAKIEKDGDLQYINNEGESMVSWTKSKFIFVNNTPMNRSYSYNEEGEKMASTNSDSLKKYSKYLLAISKDNSIESNDHFTSLIKEKGDVHFYMNMEYYSSMMPQMGNSPVTAMYSSMSKMFKGNITTGTVSFDDGKISMNTKQYVGEEMKKIFDKYKFQNVTEDMVNRIPSPNVAAAFVMNYPPDAAKEFLKAAGMDGFANMFLGKYNLNLDEVVQASKGQMVMALTDVAMNPQGKPDFFFPIPDFKFIMGMSVNNKASFDKLVNVLEAQIKDSTERNMFLSKISYQVTNDWFTIGNSPEAVQSFLADGANKLPFSGRISGHPMGAYIDIQKLISAFKSGQSNYMLDASLSTWQDFVMTGGDYKDGVATSEATINFVDQKTNSLKQLNQYAQKMYDANKKSSEERMKNYKNPMSDTTNAPVVEVVPEN